MKINKRTGRYSGKVSAINAPVIIYDAKGRGVGRRMAEKIRIPLTARLVGEWDITTRISAYAMELTQEQRDAYAQTFTATGREREIRETSRYPYFMPRIGTRPGSWYAGFLYCNLLAAHSKMTIPRTFAPFGGGPAT